MSQYKHTKQYETRPLKLVLIGKKFVPEGFGAGFWTHQMTGYIIMGFLSCKLFTFLLFSFSKPFSFISVIFIKLLILFIKFAISSKLKTYISGKIIMDFVKKAYFYVCRSWKFIYRTKYAFILLDDAQT